MSGIAVNMRLRADSWRGLGPHPAHVSGEVVPARRQMAATVGFHIIPGLPGGIALPVIVLLAEFIGLRWHDQTAMTLAQRWSQAMGFCSGGPAGRPGSGPPGRPLNWLTGSRETSTVVRSEEDLHFPNGRWFPCRPLSVRSGPGRRPCNLPDLTMCGGSRGNTGLSRDQWADERPRRGEDL